MSGGAADSSMTGDVGVLSAADAIRASLVGLTDTNALQEDLEHAAGVLRRAVARTTRFCAVTDTLNTSEEARMKLALVLDALNRIDVAVAKEAEVEAVRVAGNSLK